MIWPHGNIELKKFIDYLNQIHEKIKFTSEISNHSVSFLDTIVKIDSDNTLYTTLFEKPTDTHLYLHYDSAHHGPCHTKGPYGQFLRIRRICTKNEDFINNGVKMIEHYLKRRYPFRELEKHMLRAAKYSQDEILDIRVKEPTKVPVMTTKLNPTNPDIKLFIHGNLNVIAYNMIVPRPSLKTPSLVSKDYQILEICLLKLQFHTHQVKLRLRNNAHVLYSLGQMHLLPHHQNN